jgi:hypothetical protein
MVGDTRALVGACTGTMDSPEPGRPDRPRAAAATGDAEDREEGKPASGAWLFLSKLQHDTVWWRWVGTKQERGERGRERERGVEKERGGVGVGVGTEFGVISITRRSTWTATVAGSCCLLSSHIIFSKKPRTAAASTGVSACACACGCDEGGGASGAGVYGRRGCENRVQVRVAYMEMGTRRWGDPGLSDSGSTRQILRLPSGARALLSASGEPDILCRESKGKQCTAGREGTHGWPEDHMFTAEVDDATSATPAATISSSSTTGS